MIAIKTDLDAIDIDTRIGNTIFIGDFEKDQYPSLFSLLGLQEKRYLLEIRKADIEYLYNDANDIDLSKDGAPFLAATPCTERYKNVFREKYFSLTPSDAIELLKYLARYYKSVVSDIKDAQTKLQEKNF